MIRPSTAAVRELRAMRAVLACLAVVAQMMLPAIVLRAEAAARDLCVTSGGNDDGPSKFHEHGKQCAHCRLSTCSPLSPPAAGSISIERTHVAPAAANEAAAPRRPPLRAQPPPTGPPPA